MSSPYSDCFDIDSLVLVLGKGKWKIFLTRMVLCPWSGEWWNSRWGGGIPTPIQVEVVGYVKFGRSVCSAIRCVAMKCYPQQMRDVSWNSKVNIVTG